MSGSPSSLQALFAEMKRRHVFKVISVYGAVAFVLLQVADLAFPRLGMPDWTVTLVLMLSLFGLPIAIVLTWAFETTPDGVRRTIPAGPEEILEIVDAPRSHRWPAGLLALASVILLVSTGWYMGGGGRDAGAKSPPAGEARASGFETLAALPFRNVNGSEDNGVIAIGMHEDLLSQLSLVSSLRVTSRTSVQEYASTEESLGEIAKALGVDHLLEGAVQSSGKRVRITVRLIAAATDRTLWTRRFDKEVTPDNLLDIQTEISRAVVEQLQAQLTPEEDAALAAIQPAGSSVAQQWYYRGLAAAAGGLAELPAARDAFDQAVQIDPGYAAAWSQLARAQSRLVFVGGESDDSAARAAMERAEATAPASVPAYLARGYYEYYARQDYDAALSAFRAAERLAPSDADAVWAVGLIMRRKGEWDESTQLIQRSLRLDPRNLVRLKTLFENLSFHGAYADADAVVERSLNIAPSDPYARYSQVITRIYRDGDARGAKALAAELRLDPRILEEAYALADIARVERDWERMAEVAASVETHGVMNAELLTGMWRIESLYERGGAGLAAAVDSMRSLVTPESLPEQGVLAMRGWLDAIAGRRDAALPELREGTRRVLEWRDQMTDPAFAAMLVMGYGALGELDAGFHVLEEVVERPTLAVNETALRTSHFFDAYRDDPRFAQIIERRARFEAAGARMGEAGRPWVP